MWSGCRSPNLLRLVPVLCVAVLLFNTYRLYKGAYFFGWMTSTIVIGSLSQQRQNFRLVQERDDDAQFRPLHVAASHSIK
ncbi:MAG TPA: hypothetical protein DCK99_16570 [Blastocatellia bacterium]|nr:hypothetical protein [Blastocatellia bacterium]